MSAMWLLAGCADSPLFRHDRARALAEARGWGTAVLPTTPYRLVSHGPEAGSGGGTLTIYIEGDGLAWRDIDTPSADPTPTDPVALRLALADPGGRAVYLARPCQYVEAADRAGCRVETWTDRRFAPEALDSLDQAVSLLKARWRADRVELVGYSGGGVAAVLLASSRPDVSRVVTVAAPLSLRAWVTHHRVTPLAGSLDPVDVAETVAAIPQLHVTGRRDSTVPAAVTRDYLSRLPAAAPVRWLEVDADHGCCYDRQWPALRAGTSG